MRTSNTIQLLFNVCVCYFEKNESNKSNSSIQNGAWNVNSKVKKIILLSTSLQ